MQVRRDKGACLFLLYLGHETHKILHGWHCVEKLQLSMTPCGSWSVRQTAGEAERLWWQHSASSSGVSSGHHLSTHRVDVVAESGIVDGQSRNPLLANLTERSLLKNNEVLTKPRRMANWAQEISVKQRKPEGRNSGKINPWDSFVKTVPLDIHHFYLRLS